MRNAFLSRENFLLLVVLLEKQKLDVMEKVEPFSWVLDVFAFLLAASRVYQDINE